MISDHFGARSRELFKDALAGGCCLLGVTIDADRPVRIMEHNHVVVGKVDHVNELVMTGLDVQNGMTWGVPLSQLAGYTFLQFIPSLNLVQSVFKRQQLFSRTTRIT